MYHITDEDLERYHLGSVTDEEEPASKSETSKKSRGGSAFEGGVDAGWLDPKCDVHAAEATLEGLEKQKKGILWAIQQDPEDEDTQKMFRHIKRNIADQKSRVATLNAAAQPFGIDDAFAIATAICERFWNSENWTIQQKRAALAEVVERIGG